MHRPRGLSRFFRLQRNTIPTNISVLFTNFYLGLNIFIACRRICGETSVAEARAYSPKGDEEGKKQEQCHQRVAEPNVGK